MGGKERLDWAMGRLWEKSGGIKTNSVTAQCCSLGLTPFWLLLALWPSLALAPPHTCPASLCPWLPPCCFIPASLPQSALPQWSSSPWPSPRACPGSWPSCPSSHWPHVRWHHCGSHAREDMPGHQQLFPDQVLVMPSFPLCLLSLSSPPFLFHFPSFFSLSSSPLSFGQILFLLVCRFSDTMFAPFGLIFIPTICF